MSYETLILEHRDAVSWLYLNRPEVLNAIGKSGMVELRQAFIELRDRKETRVIVFSGKGRAFCAGADLTAKPDPEAAPSDEPTFLDLATAMEEVLLNLRKPIIAAVNGIACGGGLEMAMMCDFIIAARSARIGDAHANFGLLPGGGASVRLPRIVGVNRARYMMYTGDLFTAAEMAEAGLVTVLVEDEALEKETQAIAEKIAAKSPLGIARMKTLINDGMDIPAAHAIRMEKLMVQNHFHSYDASEGGKAFEEKRKPQFRGY
ncbi:MAG TPA: enoyl-CoA hydratase/isomerase family protein [Gammaproteobacteria bacterium]|nr:enoyl-CoA hydratase/isomerase family protein [Gammaproteobacteria bacterium]